MDINRYNDMDQGIYIVDRTYDTYGHFIKAKNVLYDRMSKYQRITVCDTEDLGRVLFLDYDFNVSTMMESFYHEPMAHIPIGITDAENVLIIGGGDFGLARHALKHKNIKSVTMCELDPDVISVSREFFPEWANTCENDERFNLYIGDGFKFLKDKTEEYDVIIVDSTDPFAKATILISEEFYDLVKKALKNSGVMMQILSDALFLPDTWKWVIPRIDKRFSSYTPLFVPIPFYVTGTWGLVLAGKNIDKIDFAKINKDYLSSIPNLKTMTEELVKGWASMPGYVKDLFDTIK